MKKILIASFVILSLNSCRSQKEGCNYKWGKEPKFRACNGVLKQVDKVAYNKVILHIKTGDTMLYVYHNFHYGIGGKRWPIEKEICFLFDGSKAIVKI